MISRMVEHTLSRGSGKVDFLTYKSIASKGVFAYLIEINLHFINMWLFPFFEYDF